MEPRTANLRQHGGATDVRKNTTRKLLSLLSDRRLPAAQKRPTAAAAAAKRSQPLTWPPRCSARSAHPGAPAAEQLKKKVQASGSHALTVGWTKPKARRRVPPRGQHNSTGQQPRGCHAAFPTFFMRASVRLKASRRSSSVSSCAGQDRKGEWVCLWEGIVCRCGQHHPADVCHS